MYIMHQTRKSKWPDFHQILPYLATSTCMIITVVHKRYQSLFSNASVVGRTLPFHQLVLPNCLGKTWQNSGKTHGNSGIYALTEPILMILENLEVIYGETQHEIPKLCC
jgi:hypothetical protein